ncbi:DnaB-like helicase C-terminal domain-containing protein [uncultured Microbulbifer sp.]|uniref:replicative DNA helicase n=1 Tax=uncultured Microbulbifer sp. TaxID=348147 RepID=UPI002629464D|nr:DnaB-like helicase C-terminal domain-containing protein [uncultured Microbulbifer sp.]
MMAKRLNRDEQNTLIAAEQMVLGGLLINPSAIEDVFEIVGRSDFMTPAHRTIATAIKSLAENSQPVDAFTVGEELNRTKKLGSAGGVAYLAELCEQTPGASNVRTYAHIAADHAHRRKLLAAFDDFSKAVYTAPIRSVTEIIGECQSSLSDLERARDTGTGPQDLDGAAREVLQDWNRLETGEQIERVHTGWDCIDRRWKGLRGGELVILAGTTGTGKTVFAMQVAAHNALNGNRALVFSLEMSRRELYRRLVGMVGRIPIGLADSDNSDDRKGFYAQHSQGMTHAVSQLKGIDMGVDDQGALHINQIVSRARREHRKSPLSLIVVDYLQQVRGDGLSREREVAGVSAGLKALAKELDIPVLALCQFNREAAKGGRPNMSQLRDSGSIEQDADIVALLYREDKDNFDSLNPGLVEVITAKHRRGEPGIDNLKAKLSQFRMDVWTAEVLQAEPPNRFRQFTG